MIQQGARIVLTAVLGLGVVCARAADPDDWTQPAEVTHDLKRCLSYRARLSGSFLVLEARIEAGWHTFAMDNRQRAAEKLQGKKALSQDLPTEIRVSGGLEIDGPWFQSVPRDFSRPQLRWFSWGFEDRALFVTRIRRTGAEPARITIGGQVCTDTTCRKVDLVISLPIKAAGTGEIDLNPLIQVRR